MPSVKNLKVEYSAASHRCANSLQHSSSGCEHAALLDEREVVLRSLRSDVFHACLESIKGHIFTESQAEGQLSGLRVLADVGKVHYADYSCFQHLGSRIKFNTLVRSKTWSVGSVDFLI